MPHAAVGGRSSLRRRNDDDVWRRSFRDRLPTRRADACEIEASGRAHRRHAESTAAEARRDSLSWVLRSAFRLWRRVAGALAKHGTIPLAQPSSRRWYARADLPVRDIVSDSGRRSQDTAQELLLRPRSTLTGAHLQGRLGKNRALRRHGPIAGACDAFYRGPIAQGDCGRHEGARWPPSGPISPLIRNWISPISTTYAAYECSVPQNTKAGRARISTSRGFDSKRWATAAYLNLLVEANESRSPIARRGWAMPCRRTRGRLKSKSTGVSRRERSREGGGHLSPMTLVTPPASRSAKQRLTIYSSADVRQRRIADSSDLRELRRGIVAGDTGTRAKPRQPVRAAASASEFSAPGAARSHARAGIGAEDNRPWLSFGVMGGDMQPQGPCSAAQPDRRRMNVQEAGEAARSGTRRRLALEAAISAEARIGLGARGLT